MAQHASTLSPPIAVSPGEAARLLGLSRQYVYHLIEVGKLRRFKIGRAARVPYADVVALMEQGVEDDRAEHDPPTP